MGNIADDFGKAEARHSHGLMGGAGLGITGVQAGVDQHLRQRCLEMAIQTFEGSPRTDGLMRRANAFLKFVKGG